jgi:hypothetical protein
MTHPSHPDILDMSDLTMRFDLMCGRCHRKDEELEEPCPGKPQCSEANMVRASSSEPA